VAAKRPSLIVGNERVPLQLVSVHQSMANRTPAQTLATALVQYLRPPLDPVIAIPRFVISPASGNPLTLQNEMTKLVLHDY
jgi:hypothetical protein